MIVESFVRMKENYDNSLPEVKNKYLEDGMEESELKEARDALGRLEMVFIGNSEYVLMTLGLL